MPIELMVKNATGLPDRYVDMAVSYIWYLEAQYQQEQRNATVAQKRTLGTLSGQFHYISDDFDQMPDCFKEYM